jgi:AcrR family transcriptional regulator
MPEADTKTRILDAAENLFAANGFGAISLRAIIKEAGVNTASVHYHFGSKEGLIEAVLERRVAPINKIRLDLLETIESRCPTGPLPLRNVVEAFLAPVIHIHRGAVAERRLLSRLLGRAITEPNHNVKESMRTVMGEIFQRFSAAFIRALPDLSPDEVVLRFYFVIGSLAFTVAGPHASEDATPSIRDHDADHITRSLVDFAVAGMSASGDRTVEKTDTE